MHTLEPYYTGSQLLQMRIKPIDGALPLSCSLEIGWDTWINQTVSCSVSEYDYNDFLNISASIYGTYNTNARMEVYQVSASNLRYRKLYQGNLLFTTESVTVRDSEPFISYTGSVTEYIIF